MGPLCVFNCNKATTVGGVTPYGTVGPSGTEGPVMNMKLYRFTVREEGQVVMDLLPAVMADGTACVVDAANNWHPIFNHGIGAFEAGSVTNSIPVPSSGE